MMYYFPKAYRIHFMIHSKSRDFEVTILGSGGAMTSDYGFWA